MPVYDKEDQKHHDDLGVHPERQEAEVDSLNKLFDEPAIDDEERNTNQPSEAEESESKAVGDAVSQSSENDNGDEQEGDWKNSVRNKPKGKFSRRKALLGGGLAGASIAGVMGISSLFLPLKLMHIVENLQEKFFASTEQAVETRAEKLFTNYVRNHILQGMTDKPYCTSTKIDRNCLGTYTKGKGPVGKLYHDWSDSRIEKRMADKWGIEIAKDSDGFYLNINGEKTLLDINDPGLGQNMKRKEVSRAVKEAVQEETKMKRALYRFKVGKYLERKMEIRLCVFACKVKDLRNDFADWKDNKKTAFKIKLIERVIMPRSEGFGILLECIISGGCDSLDSTDSDGARQSELDRKLKQTLEKYAEKYTTESAGKIIESAGKIIDKGFFRFILEEVFEQVFNKTLPQAISKSIPYIGWIDLGVTIWKTIGSAPNAIKRYVFVMNGVSMASHYMMFRSHADEIKDGKVDMELLGSMVESLGRNTKNGESAEDSPLFSMVMNSSEHNKFTLIPKALAETEYHGYTCDDGNKLQAGKKICPEESLATNNIILDAISWFKESPLGMLLDGIAWLWTPIHVALNTIGDLAVWTFEEMIKASGLSGFYETVKAKASEYTKDLFDFVARKVIPNPISEDMSGARNVNMMIGGADYAGNDYAHYGLGLKKITAQEAQAIRDSRQQEEDEKFAQRPLMKRLFDTNDTRSFVSQVAMATPFDSTDATSNLATILTNPFKNIGSAFAGILGSHRVFAQESIEDPFGIPQYGLPLNDPAYDIDPDTLTPEFCEAENARWEQDVTIDNETGMDVHSSVNMCKLDEVTADSLRALFTDEEIE